jgi:hypothetical protein
MKKWFVIALLLVAVAVDAADCNHIRIGVIRWEGMDGDASYVGRKSSEALSDPKWRSRVPDYAQTRSGGKNGYFIDGATPQVLKRDNEIAKKAGIDYWAFLYFPRGDSKRPGLDTYLSVADEQHSPKFALIVSTQHIFSENQAEVRADLARLLTSKLQFKDANDKAVVFLFLKKDFKGRFEANESRTVAEIKSFFSAVGNRSGYQLIVMGNLPEMSAFVARKIGADAISAYAVPGNQKGGRFQDLSRENEQFLNKLKEQNLPVVPLITTGKDPRPRFDTYVEGSKNMYPRKVWYEPGTARELAQHFSNSITWIRRNSQAVLGCLAIVYAWNEFDEGGWLAPTLGLGTSRIDAVGEVLKDRNR